MRLYKYLHPDRINDVLRDGTIRFTPAAELNDPFELNPHIQGLASADQLNESFKALMVKNAKETYESLTRQQKRQLSLEAFIESHLALYKQQLPFIKSLAQVVGARWNELLGNAIRNDTGVFCLSETAVAPLMWAHYADNHRGIVIEFDSDAAFFDQRKSPMDDFGYLRQIQYQSERPSLMLMDMDDFSPFLIKSSDWAYEKEWRMMMRLPEKDPECANSIARQLLPLPWEALRTVILGARTDKDTQEKVRQLLLREEARHIRILQAEIHPAEYQIEIPDLT